MVPDVSRVNSEHLKVSKDIIQVNLGRFVDEQKSNLGEGKGGKLGKPRGRLAKVRISVALPLRSLAVKHT